MDTASSAPALRSSIAGIEFFQADHDFASDGVLYGEAPIVIGVNVATPDHATAGHLGHLHADAYLVAAVLYRAVENGVSPELATGGEHVIGSDINRRPHAHYVPEVS